MAQSLLRDSTSTFACPVNRSEQANVGDSGTGISVIICCHNSSARISETLRHLARQAVPPTIPWEVILVNNASTDDTAAVAQRIWNANGVPTNLLVMEEAKPGKSFALAKGYAAARYELLLTVDDDNWLDEGYLQIACELLAERPQIGALGGLITAEFETPPPPWFENFQSQFAVGPQGSVSGDITDYKAHVAGAGMALRRSAYLELRRRGFQFACSGDRKSNLLQCEDLELCYALVLLGYRIWYDDRLHLRHFMPATRLTQESLNKLLERGRRASPILACYDAALRWPDANAFQVHLRSTSTFLKWMVKSAAKWLLGRESWFSCKISAVKFWYKLIEFPEFLRAFKQHYPKISALRSPRASG